MGFFMDGLGVPTLPGKPGILSFTFPGLENAWNREGGGESNSTVGIQEKCYFWPGGGFLGQGG